MANAASTQALNRQFKELNKHPIPGFHIDLEDNNIFTWSVGIVGPPGTIYEGGFFPATIKFPEDYPFNPPTFQFNSPFYHPNVYKDGKLCISILHPPGDDPMSGEKAEERWNPTQSVESILLSIVSLIADPNPNSPANVDAGVLYRNNRAEYDKVVMKQVLESKKNIPEGTIILTREEDFKIKAPADVEEDENFWIDDDDEDDFIESEDESLDED